ncbi:MAG: hypothetical protein HY369_05290 [Candidatus Aenigmarchaeota archaeon]|nr:hypothetical protein [Candidatus Aenigmarchaeota archaeon]
MVSRYAFIVISLAMALIVTSTLPHVGKALAMFPPSISISPNNGLAGKTPFDLPTYFIKSGMMGGQRGLFVVYPDPNLSAVFIPSGITSMGSIGRVEAHPFRDIAYVSQGFGEIAIIDTRAFQLVGTLPPATGTIIGLEVTPDGKYLVALASPSTLLLYALRLNTVAATLTVPGSAMMSISPDGTTVYVLTGGIQNAVHVIDLDTLTSLGQIPAGFELSTGPDKTLHTIGWLTATTTGAYWGITDSGFAGQSSFHPPYTIALRRGYSNLTYTDIDIGSNYLKTFAHRDRTDTLVMARVENLTHNMVTVVKGAATLCQTLIPDTQLGYFHFSPNGERAYAEGSFGFNEVNVSSCSFMHFPLPLEAQSGGWSQDNALSKDGSLFAYYYGTSSPVKMAIIDTRTHAVVSLPLVGDFSLDQIEAARVVGNL